MADAQIIYDDFGPSDTLGRLLCGTRWWFILTRSKDDPVMPCLPVGTYDLTLGMHHPNDPTGYPCYHLSNDDFPLDREFEIHIGNKVEDSKGCMLIGTDRVVVNGQREVQHSAQAHTQWMAEMNGQNGTLTISLALPV